jgi:hypothetical protein
VVLAKNARFQMEITMFSVLTIELKDSFHMLFFRLTNETLSDKRMPDICKLRGGGGWRKTFEIPS